MAARPAALAVEEASEAASGAGGAGVGVEAGGFGGDAGGSSDIGYRIMIAGTAARVAAAEKSPKSQAILKRLDEPITLHFPNETPLQEVLKHIKDTAKDADGKKLPIYVDPVGLQEAEKTLDAPVSFDLEDVPLKSALRLLLRQLGMAYCVRDGVLIISSLQGIANELNEAQRELMILYPDKFPGLRPGAGMGGGMGGMGGQGMM